MHAYIAIRGAKMWQDQFITELQGKYLPFKYPNKDNVLEDAALQLRVPPIQLLEIGFPEEQKDLVLSTILDNKKGVPNNSKYLTSLFNWVRKFIGLDPIPDFKLVPMMPICKQNLEIIGVGVKKDYWQDCKTGIRYDKKENENCFEGI